MKQKTAAIMTITVLSFFGLMTMPDNADAGRFRGGAMTQTQTATQAHYMNGGQQGPGVGFVDADGDGINDNFVDADGDGICDNTGLPVGTRPGMGNGGQGMGTGSGTGVNFVDANGDGICDLRQ